MPWADLYTYVIYGPFLQKSKICSDYWGFYVIYKHGTSQNTHGWTEEYLIYKNLSHLLGFMMIFLWIAWYFCLHWVKCFVFILRKSPGVIITSWHHMMGFPISGITPFCGFPQKHVTEKSLWILTKILVD